MAKDFVHLHVHSEYSLLDGLSNLGKLVAHVKENGMKSVAVTDHGAMYGTVDFYQVATKQEVQPIIGIEAYTTNVDHKLRPDRKDFKNFHLILLVKDIEGYKNLMQLTSIAHIEGNYYRPRFDRETLAKYSKGLICTSSCPQGELAQALIADDYKGAKSIAEWFLGVFGEDYYLEIQRHGYEKDPEMHANEKKINEGVVKLSRELGIPIVATNDAHYVKRDDATAQDALVCIATGKNVSETKRLRFIDSPTFYLKSPEEMYELFSDLPEACENTVKIAEKCDLTIPLGQWFFPKFAIPGDKEPDRYLSALAREKMAEKVPNPDKTAKDRLEYELEIINKKGYAPYFLIVMDMVNWANSKGIVTNTRGSAAGSLVSFVLGITTVNPLTYKLPFERFLNPFRPSPPDIDFDVSDNRREEVLNYICDKYGRDRVAQICTFGRMLARGSVRDVARVLGYSYSVGDRISKLIPLGSQGFPMTIELALKASPDLKSLYDSDADAKKILDLATHIEGTARHISVHAAGVVVAPTKLTDFTPIQLEPSGDKVITQYEMHACEAVGLIKFDILGIRNLSILGSAIETVNEERKVKIDILNIPLDDKETFAMLSKGGTMGVFQLGGSGMTRYLKDLKPTRVEDLMAMVALYRPGPMSVIPEYIARKNNPKLTKYLDPRMEKFLDKSFGLIVYQDDLLFCAIDLAGYSWEEADKFRKAVGKKIPAEMAAQKQKFISGIVSNGQTQKFAEMLWELFEPFQAYGFNKAHAASYGMVAYQTAYMKANYPVEFMCALLTAESSDAEKVSLGINECRRMKVKVLPPDINESDVGFKIVSDPDSLGGRGIRFGLSAIKNVGVAAIEAILESRESGNFVSFADFLSKVDGRRVNKKVLESLIKVGALSSFGGRAGLLESLDRVREKVAKPKGSPGQKGLFGLEETAKMKASSDIQIDIEAHEFTQDEIQSLERQLLGLSLSARPMSELIEPLEHMATHKIYEISPNTGLREAVKIAAVITEIRVVVTKNTASEMAFVKVEDGTGSIDLVVFPKIFKTTRDFWVDYKPLLISGRVDSREDTPALIVEAIESLETLKEAKDELAIKIPKDATVDQLRRLKNLLVRNQGDQNVILVFEGKKEKMRLPFKISWDPDLAKEINSIISS